MKYFLDVNEYKIVEIRGFLEGKTFEGNYDRLVEHSYIAIFFMWR